MGEFWRSVAWQPAKSRPNHIVAGIRVCMDWMFPSRGQAVNARHAGPVPHSPRQAIGISLAEIAETPKSWQQPARGQEVLSPGPHSSGKHGLTLRRQPDEGQ